MANGQGQGLPTQLSSQAVNTLFPGGQPALPGATPPIVPPQGGGAQAGQPDPQLSDILRRQSEMGMAGFQQAQQQSQALGQQLQGLQQQQLESAKGLAWHPNMVPVRSTTDPLTGAAIPGHGAGGFLHNIGQALIAIGAATRPGRAIESQVYAQPRQEYTGRAEAIKNIMGEQAELEKPMTAAAQLAYKPYQVQAQQTRANAAMLAAQSRASDVVMRHQDTLARIGAMKDIAEKRNATQIEITKMRDEMMTAITSMKDVTQEDVAGIMANSAQSLLNTKIAEDPSVAGAIKRAFGLSGAEAPGGAQPVTGQAPLPARPTKSAAKGGAKAGAAPKPGDVEGGYRFKGGDPSKPQSWEKVNAQR